MITPDDLLYIMDKVLKELRIKYGDTFIDRIKILQSRYIVYIVVNGRKGKIIIDKNASSIRVYTGLTGQEISIRRIIRREIDRYTRLKRLDREKPL